MAAHRISWINDIYPEKSFFPFTWRTISEDFFDFCCYRAYNYLPEGHPLIQVFRLSLLSLIGIQKEIRQSGENLPAATMQNLEQVQNLLDGQLRIMQGGFLQELATAESESESESESASEFESESENKT